MNWAASTKTLDVAKIAGHALTRLRVSGRAPSSSSIAFTPLALFGATARCSHLHTVNPLLVTPESMMMRALIERHVDDPGTDFAILSSADQLVDFWEKAFIGVVASGLGYLKMIDEGYAWTDHWKNLGGGSAATSKTPDFAFAGLGTGVALMESKGSRRARASGFDATVRRGYLDQVEPHLGHAVGGMTASHGYCIGAYLHSTTSADLRIHHTVSPATPASSGTSDLDIVSLAAVQRGNYATAFTLACGRLLGDAFREGLQPLEELRFSNFTWRDRDWITAPTPDLAFPSEAGSLVGPQLRFALDEDIARACLRRIVTGAGPAEPIGIRPIEAYLTDAAGDGAIFPDGLAVIGPDAMIENGQTVIWRPFEGDFEIMRGGGR